MASDLRRAGDDDVESSVQRVRYEAAYPVLGGYAADGSHNSIPGRGRGQAGTPQSFRPPTRKVWLAQHPLPGKLHYYSIETFTQPEHISSILAKPTR